MAQTTYADDDDEKLDLANRDAAKKLCQTIHIETVDANTRNKAELVDVPAMSFGDPVREGKYGSVWLWGKTGRPQVVMELYEDAAQQWVLVACNTSSKEIRPASTNFGWRSNRSDVHFHEFPQKSPLGDTQKLRIRQIKALATGFSAHEFWDPDNSRYELRLLPRAISTYSDPANGIMDGALFVLAHGTNPEVLLFIEAHSTGQEKSTSPTWKYGIGKLAHAELHVSFNGSEVYKSERVHGGTPSSAPYFLEILQGKNLAD